MAAASDNERKNQPGIDRMHHPLSHTSAVVAGVALLLVGSMAYIGLDNPEQWESPIWTSIFILSCAALGSSVFSYFRPNTIWVLVPVAMAGAVSLLLCVGITLLVIREVYKGWTKGILLLGGVWMFWIGYAVQQGFAVRAAWRKMRDTGSKGDDDTPWGRE